MRKMNRPKSVAILAALILVTALGQAGASATGPSHEAHSATASGCDPDDLPGASEGPDDDGDECNFTVTGNHPLPKVDQDPTGEFAQGSAALAKTCSVFKFYSYQSLGITFAAGMSLGAPTGKAWLAHFLGGSGTAIHLDDNSHLAAEVKASSVFKNYDKAVQDEIKKDLDSGVQNVMLKNWKDKSSSIHNTPDFSTLAGVTSDPFWAFGGTQGVDVSGNGFPQHGQYKGQLTYTIRDIYGFYQFKHVPYGPEMHYLQSVCGAPFRKGGAHWFEDSVTVKVNFQQPIG